MNINPNNSIISFLNFEYDYIKYSFTYLSECRLLWCRSSSCLDDRWCSRSRCLLLLVVLLLSTVSSSSDVRFVVICFSGDSSSSSCSEPQRLFFLRRCLDNSSFSLLFSISSSWIFSILLSSPSSFSFSSCSSSLRRRFLLNVDSICSVGGSSDTLVIGMGSINGCCSCSCSSSSSSSSSIA